MNNQYRAAQTKLHNVIASTNTQHKYT